MTSSTPKTLALGADHGGFELKQQLPRLRLATTNTPPARASSTTT